MSTFRYIGPDGQPAITQILYRTVVQLVGEDEPIAEYETFCAMPYAVGQEWSRHVAPPANRPPCIADTVEWVRDCETYVIRSVRHLVTLPRTAYDPPLASRHVTFVGVERL